MRWVVVSVVVHVALLWMLLAPRSMPAAPIPASPARPAIEPITVVDIFDDPQPVKHEGGGRHRGGGQARHVATSPWKEIAIGEEQPAQGQGQGQGGNGNGNGDGTGFGFDGVRVEHVPAPPPAPAMKVSKARPARLIWPKRDEEVEDDANLFIAKVTVDPQGDVVGAHMIKTTPGAKADHAANAIWTFRYAPALDEDGMPVRSTFDQPFQVR